LTAGAGGLLRRFRLFGLSLGLLCRFRQRFGLFGLSFGLLRLDFELVVVVIE
jgi:hypothetical protein